MSRLDEERDVIADARKYVTKYPHDIDVFGSASMKAVLDQYDLLDAIEVVAAAQARARVAELTDIFDRVPATVRALQYENPNVREDAYNKGVQDLADAIARTLQPETLK